MYKELKEELKKALDMLNEVILNDHYFPDLVPGFYYKRSRYIGKDPYDITEEWFFLKSASDFSESYYYKEKNSNYIYYNSDFFIKSEEVWYKYKYVRITEEEYNKIVKEYENQRTI